MNLPRGPTTRDPRIDAAVLAASLRSHADSVALASLASAGVAVILALALGAAIDSLAQMVWFGVLAGVMGVRLALWRAQQGAPDGFTHDRWLRRYRASSLLHGLVWGSIGLLLPNGAPDTALATLTLLLAGLAAGGMTLALFDLWAALLFCVPTLLPLTLRLIAAAQPVPQMILVAGAILVMMFVFFVAAARRTARERYELAAAQVAQADRTALAERSDVLLAQKSQVLEATLNSLSQGVLSIDAEGRVNAFNRRAIELLEIPESLLRARPTLEALARWQIAQGHFGADMQRMDEPGRDGLSRFVGGDPRSIARRYQRVRRDGTVLDVQSHIAADGSLVRTYTDVTDNVRAQRALSESESRFRTMADGAPALIWISGADARPVWFNQRWLDHSGRTLESELATAWSERMHPDDYPRCRIAFDDAFSRRSRFEIEFRVRGHAGAWHWVADTGIPRFAPDGRFEGYICYGWQIDERKAAEAALVTAKDEAERANRAKSDFLSRMSHELRTPLNAILGFGQLMETEAQDPLSAGQRARVQEIVRGGRQLLALINEVLDLARIESGALHLNLAAVPAGPLVDGCVRQVRPLADARGIVLQVDALPESPVLADRMRLEQVLLNLLSNAIKYNRDGGLVRVTGIDEETHVRLQVSDHGPGIAPTQQLRLFQAFERLDADSRAIEGAGIGLALSKWLVDLMEGEIGVASEVGHGSTFWVRLAKAAAAPKSAASGPTHTVLYIEDNPVNQVLMQGMLAHCPGVRLLVADAPEAGLEIAARERPDLVLLDIHLPGIDGFEVLRRLRADDATRDLGIVAVSANATAHDLDSAHAAGFDDYVTKPLEMTRLLEVVQRRLGTRTAA